jgi:cytochrome c oxidase subunit 2
MRTAIVTAATAFALILAGCGYQGTVGATPADVSGTLPKQQKPNLKGNAANGKKLFAANGCGSCHTYRPAGATGKVGPDLDKLPQYAKDANQGSLKEFVQTSIVNPSSYLEKGYPDVMPKSYGNLPSQQLADLVAFLTQKS